GEDVVQLGARLYEPRPAHHCRHAITAFPVSVLFAPEWRGAPIGPAEWRSTVVGRINHNGVVGDAEVVELFQKLTDLTIMLDHAIGIDAESRLSFRLGLEARPDVHA